MLRKVTVTSISDELQLRIWCRLKGAAVNASMLAELKCERLLGCGKTTDKWKTPAQELLWFSFWFVVGFFPFVFSKELLAAPKKARASFNAQISTSSLKSAEYVASPLENDASKLLDVVEHYRFSKVLEIKIFINVENAYCKTNLYL